jgi:hypothetical protein
MLYIIKPIVAAKIQDFFSKMKNNRHSVFLDAKFFPLKNKEVGSSHFHAFFIYNFKTFIWTELKFHKISLSLSFSLSLSPCLVLECRKTCKGGSLWAKEK